MVELTAYRRHEEIMRAEVASLKQADTFRRRAERRNADWFEADVYPLVMHVGPWCGENGVAQALPFLLGLGG